jgi:hypothetical protein
MQEQDHRKNQWKIWESNMSLTRSDIIDDASNARTFQNGENYYQDGRVKDVEVVKRKGAAWDQIQARVEGKSGVYHTEVELDDVNEVVGYYCDCPAYLEYSGACKHIVALMLHVQEIVKKREQTNAYVFNRHKNNQQHIQTDERIVAMIRRRMNRSVSALQTHGKQDKVSIEPRIEKDPMGELTLSFTIGDKRQYVIKDLSQFYIDMLEGNEVTYGKALTFQHHVNHFADESLPLLQFLMDKCSENIAYRQTRYYEGGSKRTLVISPRGMDDLFSLLSPTDGIRAKETGRNWELIFPVKENPVINCLITANEEYFTIEADTDGSLFFRGEKYLYVFKEHYLYQCDETYTEKMTDFFATLQHARFALAINRRDMGVFCTSILDDIKPYVQLTGDIDQIEPCRPMPLKAKVLIDVPVDGHMEARIEYHYGDRMINAYDETTVMDVQRDICSELLVRQIIEKHFDTVDTTRQVLVNDYDDDQLFKLILYGFDEMRQVAEVFVESTLQATHINKPPAVSIGVSVESDLLNIQFDTGEFPMDELMGVLTSYRLRKRYHRMKDGTFLDLDNTALTELSELADGLALKESDLKHGEVVVPKYRAMYIDNVIKNSAQIKSQRDGLFKDMVKNIRNVDDADFTVPESLRKILRNYQDTGYRWLQTMTQYGFGGILADDMGLGKTLQVIAVLLDYKERSLKHGVSLVTCPSSLVLNWEAEIQKFAPQLTCKTIIGSADQRKAMIEQNDQVDVVVTSYDLIKRDIELYKEKWFQFHIIDEAQYIKNQNTQNAKAVKAISSGQRFALTGTPIENRLSEIWSIFNFLMPGYLYSYGQFKKRFETPIVKQQDERALNNLTKLMKPFILRRLKKDVLTELPDKTESIVYADMAHEQRKLYLANLAFAKEEVQQQMQTGNNGKMMVLTLLMRLRQLCCHPALCYEDYKGESAKLNVCLELVEECIESGHKVLLFSQFTSMLAIIQKAFEERNISYYLLKGATKKEDRLRLVEQFNHDDTNVFLISLKAGGTGLNLTGADVVIHYDPWWNVSVQNQATDRAHRIGQNNRVQVYKLTAKDTIEDRILKLQEKKNELVQSVISEGGSSISSMTSEEIMALFDE